MKFLVFDTETTGIPLHPRAKTKLQPRVVEFAGLVVDESGEEHLEVTRLFNPGQKLDAKITQITGLTDDDLKDQPTFASFIPDLLQLLKCVDAAVAHNLPFDSTMVELEFARAQAGTPPWPSCMICTVQEHAEEWGRRPKLTELYEHFSGEELKQTHRALDDVRRTVAACIKSGVLKAWTACYRLEEQS